MRGLRSAPSSSDPVRVVAAQYFCRYFDPLQVSQISNTYSSQYNSNDSNKISSCNLTKKTKSAGLELPDGPHQRTLVLLLALLPRSRMNSRSSF